MPTVDLTYKYDTEEMLGEQGRWYLDQMKLHMELLHYHQQEYARLNELFSTYVMDRTLANPPFKFVARNSEEAGK